MIITPVRTRRAITCRLGAVMVCVALIAGCSAVSGPTLSCNMSAIDAERQAMAVPSPDARHSPVSEMPLNSISVTDADAANKVYARHATAKRTLTGTVEVRSEIANCTDFPLQIEARTQFLDADHMPSEPVSAWRRVYLAPRSNGSYREISTSSTDAQFYLIEIREGR